ncbi:hypothetical protein [Bacillus sp. Marseille-P3661]|uniref:hypothetical protein n=1 Tax=Bacillus sp. Marseille-P3661 TaxID=1936234 RepID=UPI000C861AB1|nr:hypothetical protein [Bacillus sp. Marseille-P3661]
MNYFVENSVTVTIQHGFVLIHRWMLLDYFMNRNKVDFLGVESGVDVLILLAAIALGSRVKKAQFFIETMLMVELQ